MDRIPKGPEVRPLVFVTGPYSAPTDNDIERNIQKAIDAGRALFEKGYYPIIPHILVREYYNPDDRDGLFGYESLMNYTLSMVERCDILLMIGHSPGADREKDYAVSLGIPTFFKLEQIPNR